MRLLPFVIAVAAFAGDGIAPRTAPGEYPSQKDAKTVVIGAIRLTPEQLNRSFPVELGRRYVVVEVGLYPKDGPALAVSPMDFVLKTADGSIVRPSSASEVASIWKPRDSAPGLPRNTRVATETGVTVGTATDPATGRRVNSVGTYESVGVAVGEDPRVTAPAPRSDVDPDRMEARLKTLELPEGRFTAPVAGYLFFPMPSKMKKGALEIQYARGDAEAVLPLK